MSRGKDVGATCHGILSSEEDYGVSIDGKNWKSEMVVIGNKGTGKFLRW